MNQFFTLPNMLTISRICLLPFFAYGFFLNSQIGFLISLAVFVFCCITDYLDGYYARSYHQITKLGQMLDPLADKILISVSILFIVGFKLTSIYSIIPASIILCREIIITGIRDITEKSGTDFKTSFLAKCKTATQMLSLIVILVAHIWNSSTALFVGESMFWISAIIALISGAVYCRHYHLNDMAL